MSLYDVVLAVGNGRRLDTGNRTATGRTGRTAA